ncbi:hypothetical protein VM98_09715 [Streptomyces rubellomurinus subsp. indigoferus]|nr:hypothetical protein VM98_09715 [Streptomyces rubellomurinus subsp. indigoferus]
MANNQSETPVPSTPENATQAPAAAVEAGQAVEGAVAATSNPTEYTEPNADKKGAFENEVFGDEAEHVVEPAKPATGEPGKTYEPENVVSGCP